MRISDWSSDVCSSDLKEYNYFTEITADGAALSFSTVSAYEARYEDDILTLEFTIPLAAPVDPRRVQVAFRSYDPTFYIAVEPALEDPVTFAGSPPARSQERRVGEEGVRPC